MIYGNSFAVPLAWFIVQLFVTSKWFPPLFVPSEIETTERKCSSLKAQLTTWMSRMWEMSGDGRTAWAACLLLSDKYWLSQRHLGFLVHWLMGVYCCRRSSEGINHWKDCMMIAKNLRWQNCSTEIEKKFGGYLKENSGIFQSNP